jgi:hypothetical protein
MTTTPARRTPGGGLPAGTPHARPGGPREPPGPPGVSARLGLGAFWPAAVPDQTDAPRSMMSG